MANPENAKPLGPADGIKALQKTLEDPRIEFRRGHLSMDIADLHLAFADDDDFTAATLAIGREIAIALRDPVKYGAELSGNLRGLRRAAFPPLDSRDACLRLVIEPLPKGRMRLYAFRHRHSPPKPYALVRQRRTTK